MAENLPSLYLFGGSASWSPDEWVSSDDRVRGGKSQSYLDCAPSRPTAVFRGTLDIATLGGAGFASQRSVDAKSWDLSDGYEGLLLNVTRSDGKKYTLTLKDDTLPKRPDGREQSSVSWEYDFVCDGPHGGAALFVPWADFQPTYRGRPKPDAKPLDLSAVRRISFMMRSFFGTQEGPFRLEIEYLAATKDAGKNATVCRAPPSPNSSARTSRDSLEKPVSNPPASSSWLDWLCGPFGRRNR